MKSRNLLFVALSASLLCHLGGILWFNCVPRSTPGTASEEKKESAALCSPQVNKHQVPERQEVKQTLSELQPESAPALELTFPLSTLDLPASFCAIHKSSFGGDREEQEMPLPLVTPLPPFSHLSPPPLPTIEFKDEGHEDLGILAGSEHFDIQIEYAPKRFRQGYVFKVSFLPRADVEFKRIRQNYYFLLDRSNSMSRARFFYNKKAVAEALAFLKPGDRFNILLFDDHVVRFVESVVEWNEESVAAARSFLDRQGHGGYFAATELYASLGKIIPRDVAENEINTAILLSDGDTYLSPEKQRLTIGGWTCHNHGKVSLYTIASGRGNNLPLLELLSSFNKGNLIYAQKHEEVSSRLAYLMRTIQHPIGKQMVATAVTEDKAMTILLQPKAPRIPDLYQNRPFVIYGSTNKLSNFVLFLQGRYYGIRFDIKKRISFEKAAMGAYSVERGWTQLLAQEFYERYFAEGKLSHLEGAKQLLAPLNLPVPLLE